MNILINGVAGNIGSSLGYYLHKKGHKIIGLDNFSNGYRENLYVDGEEFCEFYSADAGKDTIAWVLNNQKVGREPIDWVIHLSAISSLPQCEYSPVKCYEQNVLKVAEMLEECRRYEVKSVIFASTSAVYENNSESILTENLAVNPTLAYPLSKKHAEDVCLSYIKKYGMNVAILRFFNVFSEKGDIHRPSPPLVNYIVKQIIKKEKIQLHSDGKQSRDYISIDNVCSAINACLVQKGNGIFNICSGKTVSVNDIFESIANSLGYKDKPIYNNPENLWKDYGLTIKKELIIKEVNKYALGSNAKFYNHFGIDLNENTLQKIGETAKLIYNNYHGKL